MTSFTLSKLPTSDGVNLAVYSWPSPDRPKATIQILHGLAEHAARYDRVAMALVGAGYAVYASDHRGHGQTARDPGELGFFAARDGFAKLVADAHALRQQIGERHPGSKHILFGHSFGSFVAQAYLFTHGELLHAAVLSGSNSFVPFMSLAGSLLARAERLRVGARGKSAILQELAFGAHNKPFEPARTPYDWLSRDPVEVDKYIADPRCGFELTVQGWIDLFGGVLDNARAANLRRIPKRLPIYIFAGTRDPVGDAGAGPLRLVKAYERAGLTRTTLKLYSNARHELLNETNRDEVTADLIAWLDEISAQP